MHVLENFHILVDCEMVFRGVDNTTGDTFVHIKLKQRGVVVAFHMAATVSKQKSGTHFEQKKKNFIL